MSLINEDQIKQALQRLGELAVENGENIELIVVGGAAMVLAYQARLATHDVDVAILAPGEAKKVRKMAATIADEQQLPEDWLNDGAKGYLVGLSQGKILFSAPGIVVKRPSVAQLLAMKLSAWRDDVDIADAKRLLGELEGSSDEIWSDVQQYLLPGRELKANYAFLDLWGSIYGEN